MDFNIKLTGEELRNVLDHLAVGQHNRVRALIDNIVGQAQRQEVEAGNMPTPMPAAPADAPVDTTAA